MIIAPPDIPAPSGWVVLYGEDWGKWLLGVYPSEAAAQDAVARKRAEDQWSADCLFLVRPFVMGQRFTYADDE